MASPFQALSVCVNNHRQVLTLVNAQDPNVEVRPPAPRAVFQQFVPVALHFFQRVMLKLLLVLQVSAACFATLSVVCLRSMSRNFKPRIQAAHSA